MRYTCGIGWLFDGEFMYRLISAVLVMVVIVTGCTVAPVNAPILIGEARPAIAKSAVKIFDRAPHQAVAIAQLRTTYALAVRTSDEEKLAYAIGRLQQQAARLGGNVLVLNNVRRVSSSAGTIVRGVSSDASIETVRANPYIEVTATAYHLQGAGS